MAPATTTTTKTERYWKLVRRALNEVFHAGPGALTRADALAGRIRNAAPDEQDGFYHLEPLSVAAGIAGREPTDLEVDRYRQFQQNP